MLKINFYIKFIFSKKFEFLNFEFYSHMLIFKIINEKIYNFYVKINNGK